ncbi:MAG: tyrosine--tRNA ligase [Acholeplasmatales bacterium]|jgi:tyrosyl-tRNA synthetase|nr:tyrosine--tRNA ligase [Acholeplasmataceae bacterium]MDY0115573.1 tyrosine--tRNA ligase [Acholeplasmatales bacterium]MCK9233750.1 tyrosine--tRNA ligase [Acholeplasmataceae bacterium]MCK9289032.1 tyrosine--tRNA ligase [Acholeplasmataceae bacterium]MCK9427727.1 tyrosine--tRNA ligase [Acholeplasmataceae bacterium]
MTLYDKLIYRGLLKDVSNQEKAKKLLNDDKVAFYCGFDPTGTSLTIGHLVQIVRMKLLEKHGHTPVVLIGGATGLIGDPKETEERKLLTLEESLKNAVAIENQIKYFLPKAVYVNNYDWTKDIDMITFLRDYGKHFNVNYMLAKETVQKRLSTGISYTEFSYMILQSIDWLNLYQKHQVKIQFGGSDQWGNLTAGLELLRKVVGDNNDAVALSSPLLTKSDGGKFGKSESGTIWLDENLTSPYELYQYFYNTSDADIETYLKVLTLFEEETIEILINEHHQKPEKRLAQKALAESLVELIHGEKALKEAINVSEALFTGAFDNLTISEWEIVFKVLDSSIIDEENILTILNQTKLASSNREARQFISSGAITVNDFKVTKIDYLLKKEAAYYETYSVVRRGKKRYAIVKFR